MSNINDFLSKCEDSLAKSFKLVDETAFANFKRIHAAFQNNRVALRHFAGTTGYGYDDVGRETLCKIFAEIFGCEKAIFSPNIVSGTHAISIALFGILRPGDTLLSISGDIYDTLQSVVCGENIGSLKDFGVNFEQIELRENNFDVQAIENTLKSKKIKMVIIQRSRGYCSRAPLTIAQISEICAKIKSLSPGTIVFVDNCYGEFVDTKEPTHVGADLIAGSLIKNPDSLRQAVISREKNI